MRLLCPQMKIHSKEKNPKPKAGRTLKESRLAKDQRNLPPTMREDKSCWPRDKKAPKILLSMS